MQMMNISMKPHVPRFASQLHVLENTIQIHNYRKFITITQFLSEAA